MSSTLHAPPVAHVGTVVGGSVVGANVVDGNVVGGNVVTGGSVGSVVGIDESKTERKVRTGRM